MQRYDDFDWASIATNRKITPTCCRKRTNVSISATKDEYIAAEKKAREDSSSDDEYHPNNSTDEYEHHTLIHFSFG